MIRNFICKKYDLPYDPAIYMKGILHSHRHILLCSYVSECGLSSYGEVSPLECLHDETIEDAYEQIKALDVSACFRIKRFSIDSMKNISESFALYPSVRFGFESALLDFYAKKSNKIIPEYLNNNYQKKIDINALIIDKDNLNNELRNVVSNRCKSLKIKVGRESIDYEISMLNHIINSLPSSINIRLDANKAFFIDEATQLINAIPKDRIEYIEEPVNDTRALNTFFEKTNVPFALDESLPSVADLQQSKGLSAIILKPSFDNGISGTISYIEKAKKLGLHPILSSSFESPVGLSMIANLAAAYNLQSAIGIDTHRWFKESSQVFSQCIANGVIDIDKLNKIPIMDYLPSNSCILQ